MALRCDEAFYNACGVMSFGFAAATLAVLLELPDKAHASADKKRFRRCPACFEVTCKKAARCLQCTTAVELAS